MNSTQTSGLVFAFPARTPKVEGDRIYYLFSVRQVAEVLNQINIHPVPFAPKHAEGITQWRGQVLPVLSLENCLGIDVCGETTNLRAIVIRSILEDKIGNFSEAFTVFKVGAAIRQMDLPLACEPVRLPHWVPNASHLSGAYKLKDRLFLVIDIETIINKEHHQDHYV